jgi:hypothetical protein
MTASDIDEVGAASHPSFLALDRAYLGQASLEVTAHLRGCDACRSYVEAPVSASSSGNVALLREAVAGRERARRTRAWAAISFAAALACGFAVLVTAQLREPTEDLYVGAKGFRSVWIYVNRGSSTELWDGKKPFSPGDRLRLKVDPGEYRHLTVYHLVESEQPTLLFSGPLTPGQNSTLPEAWELDDAKASERLVVVFSQTPVGSEFRGWEKGEATPGVAILPFDLPKGAPGRDSGVTSP